MIDASPELKAAENKRIEKLKARYSLTRRKRFEADPDAKAGAARKKREYALKRQAKIYSDPVL